MRTNRLKSKTYEFELTKRLRQAIESRGTNAREISKRAGCGPSAVSDILTGRNKKPSALVLQNIASALLCPVDFFTKGGVGGEGPVVVPLLLEPNIEVVGVAETGAYREEKQEGAIIRKIAGPPHKRFPDAKCYALEMRDKSMDRAQPFPIAPGVFACFIDISEAGRQIESGNIYVVRRMLAGSQSGTMIETIVRRAVTNGGKNGTPTILRAELLGPRALSRYCGEGLIIRHDASRARGRHSVRGRRLYRGLNFLQRDRDFSPQCARVVFCKQLKSRRRFIFCRKNRDVNRTIRTNPNKSVDAIQTAGVA